MTVYISRVIIKDSRYENFISKISRIEFLSINLYIEVNEVILAVPNTEMGTKGRRGHLNTSNQSIMRRRKERLICAGASTR